MLLGISNHFPGKQLGEPANTDCIPWFLVAFNFHLRERDRERQRDRERESASIKLDRSRSEKSRGTRNRNETKIFFNQTTPLRGMLLFSPYIFNVVHEVFAITIRQRNEIKERRNLGNGKSRGRFLI